MADNTKQLILDTAERLFAQRGIEATSLRHLIKEAGVNLAAVHYHFGSKEALLEAVLCRRMVPLNQERLQALDSFEAKAKGGPVPVEQLLEALVAPALRLQAQAGCGGGFFMRLLGRVFTEPNAQLQAFLMERFKGVFLRFAAAFQQSLPELPPAEMYWRIHFCVGAMCHTMCDPERVRMMSGGLCDPDDVEENIERLVTFLAGGFRASWKSGTRKGRSQGRRTNGQGKR